MENTEMPSFTWVPLFAEIAERLADYRNRQEELVEILLKTTGSKLLLDQELAGSESRIPLTVMDPFTFYACYLRYGDDKIALYFQALKEIWRLRAEVPTDNYPGLPRVNAQKTWFFSFASMRKVYDVDHLWDLFFEARKGEINEATYQRALDVRNVGQAKITEGLFWVNPIRYLPINKPVRIYFKQQGIKPDSSTWAAFEQTMELARQHFGRPFTEISHLAYVNTEKKNTERPEKQKADDGISVEKWRELLGNSEVFRADDFKIINAFYHSSNHQNTVWAIDALVRGVAPDKKRSGSINTATYQLTQRIEQELEAPFVYRNRDDGSVAYYSMLYYEDRVEGYWEWRMRHNLVKAYEAYGVGKTPDFSLLTNTISMPSHPLNQILYGPPGTGKTYATIEMAVQIANPDFTEFANRQALHAEFRRLKDVRRIAFTTFHQSLSYEDFVEGLKPKLEEDTEEGISYEIKAGIFKSFCDAARRSILAFRPSEDTRNALDFDRKYELLAEEIGERLFQEVRVELESRSGGKVFVHSISDRGNFRIIHEEGKRIYTVGKDRLTKLYLGLKERGALTNIHDTFREIIGGSNSSAYWAVLNAVQNYSPEQLATTEQVVSTLSREALATLNREDYQRSDLPNHVLIIDEINRGNVSAILGELITLLEPDKRLGAPEELKVTLPYSRDEFGVPPNLYIIGTMNTADRSVEALDAALRRRFTFKEIGPDPDVIKREHDSGGKFTVGDLMVDLSELLTLLNRRIKALKDADHLLGHSYFLKVKDAKDLAFAFNDQIVPLLREYFFANYGQLQLVVGKGFCAVDPTDTIKFADADEGADDFDDNYKSYYFPTVEAGNLAAALRQLGLS